MTKESNNKIIRAARVSSGMTQEQAAELICVSQPTYLAREKLPKSFTIDELEDLFAGFNEDGKKLIQGFVGDIFLI